MDKEVSIVLSKEKANYRKLAQEHWGLTREQMEGMHVHHQPPLSQGGRNIPEHLYVCSPSMHANGWHDLGFWVETQARAASKQPREVRQRNGRKVGEWSKKKFDTDPQFRAEKSERSRQVARSLSPETRSKAAKEQHQQKWMCTETGFISTPCGLSAYQRARGISTSCRVRVK